MTVSFLGDGIFFVALAWQAYQLSNAPTALSVVFIAMSLPHVCFVMLAGVLADRFERRRVMIAADVIRGVAVTAVGVLSVTGTLALWHLIVLAALYGAGEAFFGPAFGALVPEIVPPHLIPQANSLDQFVRPFALQLAGPALGGWVIAAVGAGGAFLADAGSFVVSGASLLALTPRPLERPETPVLRGAVAELREGFAFVRSQTWLWATLVAAACFLLVGYGPWEVLLPFVVKNSLGGSAADLGLVFAAGGAGAVLAAAVMGQIDVPRRHILVMYLGWTLGGVGPIVYGLGTRLWQLAAAALVAGAGTAVGMIIWGTLMQRLVPGELLGRVTSLDWFISISLIPLSFALTGPVAAAVGVRTTLVGAGAIGAFVTVAFLLVPGIRDTERSGVLRIPLEGS